MGRGHSSSRRVRDANAMNDQPASLSHQLVPAVGKGIHRLAIARKLLSQSGTGIRSFKPSGECPPLYDVLDPERIAHDHLGLINSYDPQLGSALKQYYAADKALRNENLTTNRIWRYPEVTRRCGDAPLILRLHPTHSEGQSSDVVKLLGLDRDSSFLFRT